MLELLAAIVQTDPAPIAGWMLLLLALGMYPVGILFPSCCACSKPPCTECQTGALPNTVTVTFPEWDNEMLGEYRHRIAFSTLTPWASNAVRPSARVSETVAGEITKVEFLSKGSGYALVGRVAPTLTISGGGGTGATFTPTLTSSGTPAVWTLASATASGGSGYVDASSLTITAAAGDTTVTKTTATVVARGEPTITATGPGGSGASLSVSLSQSGSPPTWAVSGVTVSAGGTGYTNEGAVTFSSTGTTTVTAPAATVSTLEQASHTVDASGAGGSGAAFSITYEEDVEFPGYWYITNIAVTNGGSGYSSGGTVLLKPATGTRFGVWPDGDASDIVLGYTLSGGAIASVSGYDNEVYYRDRGIIQSVTVTVGGSVYANTGAAYGVTVTDGGSYYREDKSVSPYVASVTATVENGGVFGNAPSLTPVVDDDPYSGTFGQIESVTITDGGGGHKARTIYLGKKCCKPVFEEKSFVLLRSADDPCTFIYQKCEGFGTTRMVLTIPSNTTEYGPQPPFLETFSYDQGVYTGDQATTFCYTRWTATTLVPDCSDFEFDLESGARIATVVPGGDYHGAELPQICSRCCTSGALPDEIEVELESIPYESVGTTFSDFDNWEGTYVLAVGSVVAGPQTSVAWGFYGEMPSLGEPIIEAIAGGDSIGLAILSGTGTPKTYTVTGVNITAPGTGFTVGDPITFDITFGGTSDAPSFPASGQVSSVGANGEILAVSITNAGSYQGYWIAIQVQMQHCGNPAQPPDGVGTPDAAAAWPNNLVRFQDYLAYCETECNQKCFLIAQIVRWAGDPVEDIATDWDDSKPYSEETLADCGALYDYDDMDGYECGQWPGRPERPAATCDACESNLCDLSGREIVISRLIGGEYSDRGRLTIQ